MRRAWVMGCMFIIACGGAQSAGLLTVTPGVLTLHPLQTVTFGVTGSGGPFRWSLDPVGMATLSGDTGDKVQLSGPSTVSAQSTLTLSVTDGQRTGRATITLEAGLAGADFDGGVGIPVVNDGGTLILVIQAPDAGAGITPDVYVYGPGNYLADVTSSMSITVPSGTCEVVARTLSTVDPIVGAAFRGLVTGSPVDVAWGQTATVSVDYGPLPGSGYLWMPDDTNHVYGYSASRLRASTGVLPASLTLTTPGGNTEAVAFDRQGTLWVLASKNGVAGALYGWTLYTDGGASAPSTVTILNDAGISPLTKSIAFAPNGDLWVVAYSADQLYRYTPAQLAAGGVQVPVQTVSSTPMAGNGFSMPSLSAPNAALFDASGNLWVVNLLGKSAVRFPAQVDGTLNVTPDALLFDDAGTSFSVLSGAAFDSHGELWVASFDNSALLQLESHVSPGVQAAVFGRRIIDNGSHALFNPDGFTFDQSGHIWVTNQGNKQLVELADPSALQGDSAPNVLAAFDAGVAFDTGKLQFNPPAAGLGLYP